MRRILITGAAGFVGRHVTAALAAEPSTTIIGIGRGRPDTLPPGVAFYSVDLLDEAALSAVVAEVRPTDVLHLAAMASVHQSAGTPTETWRANVVGLLNLADALSRHTSGSTVVFASSGEVYGRAFLAGHALSEDASPEPVGAYARSKWFGEQILADVLPRAGIRLVVLRPFNHIGPGQDERFVVPSFARQIARIEAGLVPPVLEVGNLDVLRDFLPIEDVVRAYVGVIARIEQIASGTVFNVASGRPRTIASVLDDLTALARVPFTVRVAPDRMRPSEILMAAGDSSRLTEATGWRPEGNWTAALASVFDEARSWQRGKNLKVE